MIELTTGVVFLMSSLYGSGVADNHMANIANASSAVAEKTASSTVEIFTTNDSKVMEMYLRREYANDPILVDIARCESNFRQFDKDGNIIHGIANKADVGVMQINKAYHAESAAKLGLDLYTVEGNVAYAKHLYNEEGTKPWSASQKCWSVGNAVAKK